MYCRLLAQIDDEAPAFLGRQLGEHRVAQAVGSHNVGNSYVFPAMFQNTVKGIDPSKV